MAIKEQIMTDLKTAMKAADSAKTTVLRGVLSAFNNKAIEKRSKTGKEEMLSEEEMLAVLMTESKKRKDAIELYKQGGREDLVQKETQELSIVQVYLPKQLSEEETKKAVGDILQKTGLKEFGPAMKEVMKELKGKADAAVITKTIKESLGS